MKNTNGNDETPTQKKLTVEDLKKVIGGLRPRDILAEDSKNNKVVLT